MTEFNFIKAANFVDCQDEVKLNLKVYEVMSITTDAAFVMGEIGNYQIIGIFNLFELISSSSIPILSQLCFYDSLH